MSERSERPTIAVVGGGMVGQRFLEAAVARDLHRTHRLVLVGEEPHAPYDRVHLSDLFAGLDAEDLLLSPAGWHAAHGIELRTGQRVTSIDLLARALATEAGDEVPYDHCVLATGSSAFVPPVPGIDAAGCFVERTIVDVEAIRAWCAAGAQQGVVLGGGLLGLEAAKALRDLGVHVTVVEVADRLMANQLDDGGARVLRRAIEGLGIDVRTGHAAEAITAGPEGAVEAVVVDGEQIAADVVVVAAGIRPRDDLARAGGVRVGDRGGIEVDDRLVTSDPNVSAIGECALHRGRIYGLVAPGQRMAEVVADRLAGSAVDARFEGADSSTTLKLLGVDVAVAGERDGADSITFSDPVSGSYTKLVLDTDQRVVGGVFVGDTRPFPSVLAVVRGLAPAPERPADLLVSADTGTGGVSLVCSCHNITRVAIRDAIRDRDLEDVPAIKACTKAGTGCGSCVPILTELLRDELAAAGKTVDRSLCEHFSVTRQELFDVVRASGIRTFAELVARHGRGRGCEVCKPAVASLLASVGTGHILDGEQASLQDTNDHFLANLQRDGTYSVVPRVPGGEITPEKLIVLGEVARDFDLYTKITGGQRIDLFGARVEQLPAIWRRLVDAGFESGHAYGKAMRTVKSCVGSTWCRYGVQDSVDMAVRLELRYRGLRAPHKIKLAVSGCARECAEAQSKDVGVIATERGWNLYVCGNGGMRPQHAQLLAEDVDDEDLLRFIDRFLVFYIRTADRLQRTAPWLNERPGGIDELRRIVVDDALGIAADLEGAMAHHVASYECEWKATLEDPARLARFRSFVNSDATDPDLTYVRVRGQRQPVPAG